MKDARVAIVTGSAGGIGEGIAHRLVESGHSVAMIDIDADACSAAADKLIGNALAVHADVSDPASISEAVRLVSAKLGPPAILVNNAGFARDTPFDQMTLEQWNSVQGVHLRGSFLAA